MPKGQVCPFEIGDIFLPISSWEILGGTLVHSAGGVGYREVFFTRPFLVMTIKLFRWLERYICLTKLATVGCTFSYCTKPFSVGNGRGHLNKINKLDPIFKI